MANFDLNDPEFLRDPNPTLVKMREQGALVRLKVPLIGSCWTTTTDAAARAVLKDDIHFARNPALAGGRDISRYYWFLPSFMRPIARNILGLDGDEHKRIRAAVDQSFSRNAIEALHSEITQIADDLLDQLDPSQPIDITAEYARILPLDVISALLGIHPILRRDLARAIAPISGPTNALTLLRVMPGIYKSLKLLRAEISVIRQEPRIGLLSNLIHNTDSNLSDDEILSLAFVLFVAGHETTLHLISNAIFALSENAEQRQRLQTCDETTTSRLVEEYMRFFNPVMMTKPLFVRKDLHLLGQDLKQGDKVLALLIAANHDPERFEAPYNIQPARRPNAHIGFGFGPHVCLGMQLARSETQIALERLFTRFPNLERSPKDAPPIFTKRFGLRGMKTLKILLEP